MMFLPASLGMLRPASAAASYLDDLSTLPIYAISLKKLVSTATNAIRVRRSSDNAERDIGFSGNALDTTDLLAWSGSDSVYVVTAYDQSGNGYNWTQATSSKQPRIVNAGSYDGLMRWDGTDDSMAAAAVPLSQPQMAIFLDGVLTAASGTAIYLEASANWNSNAYALVIAYDASNWQAGMNSATPATNQRVVQYPGLAMGTRKRLAMLFDRTKTGIDEILAWTNGSAVGGASVIGYTFDQTGSFATHSHYLGGRAGTSLYTAPHVFSLVCYNADVSGIRANIEAILA